MLIFEKHKNVSYLYPPEIYFTCPVIPKVGSISCHKINMQRFCDDLANISIMLSPASAAVDLYDQYIHGLGCLLDIHAPLICGRIKKKQLVGCQIHIAGPNLFGANLSVCGIKIGLS